MSDIRVMFLIAGACCVAGSGCQDAAPASATNRANHPAVANNPQGVGLSESIDNASPQSADCEPLTPSSVGAIIPPAAVPALPSDGRPIPITFDDLHLEMKEDSVFDPRLLTPRIKQLDGQRVRIRGFIFPSILQQKGITRFPLVKNTECKFGPGGIAHHIIMVDLRPGVSTSFTVRPIAVEGLLTVRPWTGPDGMTWTVYHMLGEKVK
jgi:hypothetical protein